jgi:hypothetical protein
VPFAFFFQIPNQAKTKSKENTKQKQSSLVLVLAAGVILFFLIFSNSLALT